MPVSAGGETADTEGLPVDRQDARTGRGSASTSRSRLLICLALVVLIGAIGGAAWIRFGPNLLFDEPSCASPVRGPRGGCMASLPIPDIAVTITATVRLSPNGDTLLLGGPLRDDQKKVVQAGVNIAERRQDMQAGGHAFRTARP